MNNTWYTCVCIWSWSQLVLLTKWQGPAY